MSRALIMKRSMLAGVLLSGIVIAAPASAGAPLTTGPLWAAVGGRIDCKVVNVSTQPVSVLIEIVDEITGLNTGSCNDTVPPGQAAPNCNIVGEQGQGINKAYYCRFTGASKKKVRGTITSSEPTVGFDYQPIATLLAQ